MWLGRGLSPSRSPQFVNGHGLAVVVTVGWKDTDLNRLLDAVATTQGFAAYFRHSPHQSNHAGRSELTQGSILTSLRPHASPEWMKSTHMGEVRADMLSEIKENCNFQADRLSGLTDIRLLRKKLKCWFNILDEVLWETTQLTFQTKACEEMVQFKAKIYGN